jgi:hypothetical protein
VTSIEKQLLEIFLDDLSDRFSCDSCNDFWLDEVIPDIETRRSFMRTIDPDDYDDSRDYRVVSNTTLLSWVKRVYAH